MYSSRNKSEVKASFQHKIATFYFIQRRFDESEKLYLSALDIRKNILGDSHPDTLKTTSCLAALYKLIGKYKEAIVHYKKYISIVGDSDYEAVTNLRECEELWIRGGDNHIPDRKSHDLVSLWTFSKVPRVYEAFRKLLSTEATTSTTVEVIPTLNMETLRKIAGTDHICTVEKGKMIDRTPESNEAYAAHKARLSAEGMTMKEYITKDIFSNDLKNKPWVLTKNAFPYKVESNIMHLVMWHNSPDRDMEGLKAIIEEVFQGSDYTWFANADELMSVPVFFHGQVFVKI